jgi:hypothetical protein
VRRGPITLHQALHDQRLLGAALGDPATWQTWFAVLKAAYGEALTDAELERFERVAGGRKPPRCKVRRFVAAVSRRAGKGRAAAALATYESVALVDHRNRLAPGEVGVVAVISPTRAQSAIVRDYTLGYFEASPVLRGEVAETTADEIRLKSGAVICTLSSDYRTLRGRTLLLAVLDEASFLRDETSSTPDIEAARALLPGLATTGGMLVVLSSPYRRTGLLFQLHRDYFSKASDEALVVAGASTDFNPTLDSDGVAAALAADPEAARSEWLGEWRSDLAAFLDDATIEAAIDRSRPLELPPRVGFNYVAFTDSSAGRHDAFTVCIAHVANGRVFADVVQGRKPPFDPASVATDYAILATEYGCRVVHGDSFSGEWVASAFRAAGVEYQRAELTRSELYLEGLPLWARGLVSIPDHYQLLRELRLLERRTARSGRDSVDHGVGGTDDYANALFGALVLANTHRSLNITPELIARAQALPRRRASFGFGRPSTFIVPKSSQCYPASFLPLGKVVQQREGEGT